MEPRVKNPKPDNRREARLTDRNKRVIDIYLSERVSKIEAYRRVYDVDYHIASKAVYRMFAQKAVQEYYEKEVNRITKKIDIKKEDMIEKTLSVMKAFEIAFELGNRDKLTKEEEKRFFRIQSLIKATDYNKATEIINKMLGFNEPDEINLTETKIVAKFK